MNKLPEPMRVQILSMLCEGSSMGRSACDVSINTVTKLLIDAGTVCAALHDDKANNHGQPRSRPMSTRLLPSARISPCGCQCTASLGCQMHSQRSSRTIAMRWRCISFSTTSAVFTGFLALPPMASGLCDHVMKMTDCITLIAAANPVPTLRGPYKKREVIQISI